MTGKGLGWAWIVVALFTVSGLVHLARPSTFGAQVPDFLPLRTAVVVLSGVAELSCAGLMVWPRTRRLGGALTALLLVAIFPGNLWQAFETGRDWRAGTGSGGVFAVALVRLPLQVPLIWWAWRVRAAHPDCRRPG